MIGTQELILILIVALFLFGPTKLPELARSLGKAAGEFKKAQIEAEHEVRQDKTLNESDTKVHNLAIEMGLEDVQNKTTEQLIEEIRLKIKSGECLPLKGSV